MFFVTALSWFVPSYCSWRPKYQICIATTRIKYNGWYPKVKLDFTFCYFTWRSLLFLFLGPMKYHCACEHSDESTYLRGYTGCVLPRPVLLEAALDDILTKRKFITQLLMEIVKTYLEHNGTSNDCEGCEHYIVHGRDNCCIECIQRLPKGIHIRTNHRPKVSLGITMYLVEIN